MNEIKRMNGTITNIQELSPTARLYTITPEQSFKFTAGAFVNIFIEHNGKDIRRAFSMSSDDQDDTSFTLSIRHSPGGELTPLLWNNDYLGKSIRLMGPLGLNTANKIQANNVFLFGFGIGAGVVKSLTQSIASRPNLESLTIMTGNRSLEEIIHKDYFDSLTATNPKVTTKYIISDKNQTTYPAGYIQDHIGSFDFNNADIYMCGQKIACTTLENTIKSTNPQNCNFFIEDFH